MGGTMPGGKDPTCEWRERLIELLDAWVAESPAEALHATYSYTTDARPSGRKAKILAERYED
jgi:hypothetical protein